MTTILILAIFLFIIYGSAIVWCIRSSRRVFGKRSAKVIKMNAELKEMLDYKLDREYQKVKSC